MFCYGPSADVIPRLERRLSRVRAARLPGACAAAGRALLALQRPPCGGSGRAPIMHTLGRTQRHLPQTYPPPNHPGPQPPTPQGGCELGSEYAGGDSSGALSGGSRGGVPNVTTRQLQPAQLESALDKLFEGGFGQDGCVC